MLNLRKKDRFVKVQSWLLRCFTSRESSSGFSLVSPTKVKACKLFYSLKTSLVKKIKNNKFILLAHYIKRNGSVDLSGVQ